MFIRGCNYGIASGMIPWQQALAILEHRRDFDTMRDAVPKMSQASRAFRTRDACFSSKLNHATAARIDFKPIGLAAGLPAATKENAKAGPHRHEHPRARFGNCRNTSRIRRLAARGCQLREGLCRDKLEGYDIGPRSRGCQRV